MRKVILEEHISLDGVIQGPGGPGEDPSEGFKLGGWSAGYSHETIGEFIAGEFRQPFDLLLGRKTYDIWASYWPSKGDDPSSSVHEVGAAFNQATKYVATHHPDTLTWEESRGLGDDAIGAVRALKTSDGPPLLTWGSSDLARQLLAAGLVDELRLIIYPVLLGRGKRLYDGKAEPAGFRIERSAITPTGVILATYAHDGEVKTGNYAAA